MLKQIKTFLRLAFWCTLSLVLLTKASVPPGDRIENVRAYTRNIEFDYIRWTINAAFTKVSQASLDIPRFLPEDDQIVLVKDNLSLTGEIRTTEAMIEIIYSDPTIDDPYTAAEEYGSQLVKLKTLQSFLGLLSESILQQQTSQILQDLHIAYGGQPFPPLFYRITPLPYALIVSPLDTIRQDANISLLPDMPLDSRILLEQEVEENLGVSALVVPVGGVGVYPTMVLSTSNLMSLTEIISHEWTHNFLTLRPLGINYFTSDILRTMNETTASISGKEIGLATLTDYYPEFVPPAPSSKPYATYQTHPDELGEPLAFDFRAEMQTTRMTVDQLLAEEKITEAETYMEERRQYLWENGYQIRRLNQAYFAFHGAYADTPGGAAGDDPVGAAVRLLRAESASLSEFLNKISWISSFERLRAVVGATP